MLTFLVMKYKCFDDLVEESYSGGQTFHTDLVNK